MPVPGYYIQAAKKSLRDLDHFWANQLGISLEQSASLINDSAKFQNLIRAKLMKRGRPGYVEPTPENFPSVEQIHELVCSCGALPTFAWLDGSSQCEQDIEELVSILMKKGVDAVNITPDRKDY